MGGSRRGNGVVACFVWRPPAANCWYYLPECCRRVFCKLAGQYGCGERDEGMERLRKANSAQVEHSFQWLQINVRSEKSLRDHHARGRRYECIRLRPKTG